MPALDRIGLRLSPADAADLQAVADALRAARRSSFVSITDAAVTAIRAAATLARDGVLMDVANAKPAGR